MLLSDIHGETIKILSSARLADQAADVFEWVMVFILAIPETSCVVGNVSKLFYILNYKLTFVSHWLHLRTSVTGLAK